MLLGTSRLPNSGRGQPDMVAGPLAIEHKSRKSLPQWLVEAVRQAERNAGPDQCPLVVLSQAGGRGRKIERYVVMTLDSFTERFGEPLQIGSDLESLDSVPENFS
jgi:hypothetical protein